MSEIGASSTPTPQCGEAVPSRLPLGRYAVAGVGIGPTRRLPVGHSLLIVGPTQAGKTTSLVLPAVLSWTGALVLTSVKHDVVGTSLGWRSRVGRVQRLDPGEDHGLTWNPLEGIRGIRDGVRVASTMTLVGGRGDSEFWNALATKLLGALFTVAVATDRTIFDVARAVERRTWMQWDDTPLGDELIGPFRAYDARTLDGVVTTVEAMVLPWRFPQPLAAVRETVAGPNTLYLCSPRHEQRSYEPLFRGALRMVLEEQQRRVDDGTAQPLLMVLDEAANVASLEELDQMAATVAGLQVTLVTVVQDFAQLRARWGDRAATIVNNHATRVVLGGLADPSVATYLPELTTSTKERPMIPLRLRPGGTALVVSGRAKVYPIRLRPWWRRRQLRHRGRVGPLDTLDA